MKKRIPVIFALLTTAVFYLTPVISGCGPFFPEAVFTYKKHPDFPLERYAGGDLGVLQKSYARSYLYVAYRHMNGTGFSDKEQKELLALWNDRLSFGSSYDSSEAESKWLDFRKKIPGSAPLDSVGAYKSENGPDYYIGYINCGNDAFNNAEKTLAKRIEKFGIDSAEVKDWIKAQDQVFANCSGSVPTLLPAPAAPGANPLIKADREYQIAAAHFYAGNFDESETRFKAIAKDNASPWRQIAPYLAARSLIRKASLRSGKADAIDASVMTQAETQLKSVLADKNYNILHPSTQRLLNRVRLNLYPEKRASELAELLLQKNSEKNLKQDLWDYTALLDEYYPNSETPPKTLNAAEDLTDWIAAFQNDEKPDRSIEKWEKTGSLAWLAAAISKIEAKSPKLASILDAAAKTRQDSPAYATIAFHKIRLLMEANRKDDARRELDELLSGAAKSFPPSSINLFVGKRMALASSFDEFLKYAPRIPAGIIYTYNDLELPYASAEIDKETRLMEVMTRGAFDWDSAAAFNDMLPLAMLAEAAKSRRLPDNLRREAAIAAWTRAVILDEEETAKTLAPILQTLEPELKDILKTYMEVPDATAKKDAAIFLLLRYPGMRPIVDSNLGRETSIEEIDSYRDNWWCALGEFAFFTANALADENKDKIAPLPALDFLTDAQKKAAEKEHKRLKELGAGPNYLCNQAIEWGKRAPDDPRIPEALHIAVKTTRFGCTNEQTTGFSKAAFQLLHKKYPQSEWAKKTKYYY